jgi:hypothetical protein
MLIMFVVYVILVALCCDLNVIGLCTFRSSCDSSSPVVKDLDFAFCSLNLHFVADT